LPVAALVGAAAGVVLLRPVIRRDTVVDQEGALGRALRFGLQNWGANMLQQINYRFDVLILGAFATASDVGVYSVALTLTSTSWILPQALQIVLFPRVASMHEATLAGEVRPEEADANLAKAVRHGVLLTLPAGLVIAVLLVVAVPLVYGPQFHETTWLGFVLLPGTLMLGVSKVLTSAAVGRGRPRYLLYSGAISVPVTLALYFALIPPFHAWGAAVGSSVSYGLTALMWLFLFRRVTALGFREAFVPRAADVADYGGLLRLAINWRGHR
jgi:O-antigen/teichoic acid export membrane protein